MIEQHLVYQNAQIPLPLMFKPRHEKTYLQGLRPGTTQTGLLSYTDSCQNVCEALIYHLDNIYIRFDTKLYRQIVGIPMGTNCAPLVADLFYFAMKEIS